MTTTTHQPCTNALDTHNWRLYDQVQLSLPDCDGFVERHCTWECAWCGRVTHSTGDMAQHRPIPRPDAWQAWVASRPATDAYAQLVEQQARIARQGAWMRARLTPGWGGM